MKKLLGALVVLGIAAVTGWQIRVRIVASGQEAARRRGQVVVPVEVTAVRQADIRDVGAFTGSLEPKSQFLIAPKIAGRLEKLRVHVGDRVRHGQLIAELDDEEFAQELEQARAELAVARANVADCFSALTVAKREFERVTALRAKGFASESELDSAEAQDKACDAKHKVALAQVANKDAALKAAQIRLSYAKVHASWEDGNEPRVVGERFVDEGALLKANEPIVSILEDRRLIAVIHVIERDYPKVKVAQEVSVTTDAYPRRTFGGRIVRIAPLLKETSRQGRVEVEIDNPDRLLKPGMWIRARIEFARHEKATVIPKGVRVTREEKEGVFVADADARKVRFVPITVGIIEGELAEVVEPPLSGLVVSLGQHLLEDGSSIRLPQRPASRPAQGGAPAGTPPESRPATKPGETR